MNIFNYNRKTLEHCIFNKTIEPLTLCKVIDSDKVHQVLREHNVEDTNKFQSLLSTSDGIVAGSFVLKLMDPDNDKLKPSDIDFFYMDDTKLNEHYNTKMIQYIKKCKWNIDENGAYVEHGNNVPSELQNDIMLDKLYFGLLTILHFDLDCCRYFMVTYNNKYYIFTTDRDSTCIHNGFNVEMNRSYFGDDGSRLSDACHSDNARSNANNSMSNNDTNQVYDSINHKNNNVSNTNSNADNTNSNANDRNNTSNNASNKHKIVNYVDKFNMRSDKVWKRIKKYEERGYDYVTEVETPSINIQIKSYSEYKKCNIVYDVRDNTHYLAFQHGIPLNRSYCDMKFPLNRDNINVDESLREIIENRSNDYHMLIKHYRLLVNSYNHNNYNGTYSRLTIQVLSQLIKCICNRINETVGIDNAVMATSYTDLVNQSKTHPLCRIICRRFDDFINESWTDAIYYDLFAWKCANYSDNYTIKPFMYVKEHGLESSYKLYISWAHAESNRILVKHDTFKDALKAYLSGYIGFKTISKEQFNKLVEVASGYSMKVQDFIKYFKKFDASLNDLYYLPHPLMQFRETLFGNYEVTEYFMYAITSNDPIQCATTFDNDCLMKLVKQKIFDKPVLLNDVEFHYNFETCNNRYYQVARFGDSNVFDSNYDVYTQVNNVMELIDPESNRNPTHFNCRTLIKPRKDLIHKTAGIDYDRYKFSDELYKLRSKPTFNTNYHEKKLQKPKVVKINKYCCYPLRSDDVLYEQKHSKDRIVSNDERMCIIDGRALYMYFNYGNLVHIYEDPIINKV